tara:strand:- start:1 stop:222 length:222 start_codon:yes stop_codon:yes gene_type:complete
MKLIKQFTAIQISSKTVDNVVEPIFEYGSIHGPYYDQSHPETTFDTEDEAIKWAHNECSYSTWMIIPIISFDN